ncbi:MAG TPA: efflux RND transporter periplasmic adaptor subunit [Verrucomicrobiae bacterium]|jgi:HlyD family secretion protein
MASYKSFPWLKGLILLLLGGVAAAGWWYYKKQNDTAPQYQTASVTRGDLTQAVTATGTLNPVVNVQVGSQISGIILKLFADFNSPVKEGQVIAQLDAATYRATVAQAEGNLMNAKASLELAQINARRSQTLQTNALIPTSDLDKATAELHQAEASVKINEANLEKVKVDLSRCTIYAPVDGVVISRNVDVGQTVAASLSAPTIFVIANDLAKMQIDSNVAEADVGGIEIGQDVDFTVDAFPTRTFHGRVVQVRNSPITVQNVVTYDTVIEVNNADLKLKPGMTANVSIIVARKEDVIKMPVSALRFRPPEAAATNLAAAARLAAGRNGSGWGSGRGERPSGGPGAGKPRGERPMARTVYLLSTNAPAGGDTAKTALQPVQVKTGISDGIFTEIIEGLSEGMVVVTGSTTPNSASARPPANPFGGGGMRRF